MAVTWTEAEALPASYPAVSGLSAAAAALNEDALWQRIESYCRVRWTPREVVWTIEGDGDWNVPLWPATLNTVEVWENFAWVECSPYPSPSPWGGYEFLGEGPYRVTADVGGGDVPAAVTEAFRRLAEYSADLGENSMMSGHPAHKSHAVQLGESVQESFARDSTWAARALQLSGAADLLRPYRRRA
ncbi:hypothetical protein [Thalassovita sp.]|uniref:hypothetical protein n=1 Tax=Thalassovita sp. TaxID=1979401 RepID=UPI0029DE550A|nr:hypothetical protein [Thalassovita sp.]